MEKDNFLKEGVIMGVIIGVIVSLLGVYVLHTVTHNDESSSERIQEYYNSETSANISAHGLRKKINTGDTSFVLVDVRSEEEYLEGHIVGAISIPAYTDRDNTQHISNERILKAFSEIAPGKEIITYCYSAYCMTSRKIGKYLSENGVYPKHLTVGWNEWRYHWDLWNYPHEADETEKYIASGEEPGTMEGVEPVSDSCGISGDFGC